MDYYAKLKLKEKIETGPTWTLLTSGSLTYSGLMLDRVGVFLLKKNVGPGPPHKYPLPRATPFLAILSEKIEFLQVDFPILWFIHLFDSLVLIFFVDPCCLTTFQMIIVYFYYFVLGLIIYCIWEAWRAGVRIGYYIFEVLDCYYYAIFIVSLLMQLIFFFLFFIEVLLCLWCCVV